MNRLTLAALGLALSTPIAACTDAAPDPDPIVPRGDHYHYVVDSIDLPESARNALDLGLDLDGDDRARPDNGLGQVLAAVIGQTGHDLDAEGLALIEAGAILHLLDLQATDLAEATEVGLEVLHGLDLDGDPSDNFSGSEAFGVDDTRGAGLLVGSISDGRVDVALGQVPVAFTFPGLGEAFIVPLSHARIVGSVDAGGMSGVIGGGISARDLDEVFVPALHRGFDNIVRRDCDETSCSSEFADLLLDVFDTSPYDRAITLEEVRGSAVVRSLLVPDVDLERADEPGIYRPRSDGIKEHLSVGIGFTAVRARIQR